MYKRQVRINDDIRTTGSGESGWGKPVADFTQDLAVRLPEAFWVNVLLFEFVGDDFNQAMRKDPDLAASADGRRLHPILVAMGLAHTAEEARHLAYAKKWLQEGMGDLDDAQITEVQNITELGAQALIDRQSFLPVRYTDQLAPYLSESEFVEARGVSPAARAMLRQLKKLLDEFESWRAVRPETMRRWEDAGAFD